MPPPQAYVRALHSLAAGPQHVGSLVSPRQVLSAPTEHNDERSLRIYVAVQWSFTGIFSPCQPTRGVGGLGLTEISMRGGTSEYIYKGLWNRLRSTIDLCRSAANRLWHGASRRETDRKTETTDEKTSKVHRADIGV